MYIEDLFCTMAYCPLSVQSNLNEYEQGIVESFLTHIQRGRAFTEKQRALALRLLKKTIRQVSVYKNEDLSIHLTHPQFKYPVCEITKDRKIEMVNHSAHGAVFKLTFPYDEQIISKLRNNRCKFGTTTWDSDNKAWYLSVNEYNLLFLSNLIANNEFQVDETFTLLNSQVSEIRNSTESIVPMLIMENGLPVLKNVSEFVPQLKSTSVIGRLFEARKLGVTTWDEEIDNFVNNLTGDYITKSFLNSPIDRSLTVDCNKTPIENLREVIEYASPCLFILPGGNEVVKFKLAYDLLKTFDWPKGSISVLFRMPSDTGKEFNQYVKNQELNAPVSDKTKAIFVGHQSFKNLLKANFEFNSVVSMGFGSVHYTLQNFLKNCPNVIFYLEQSAQKEIQFWQAAKL